MTQPMHSQVLYVDKYCDLFVGLETIDAAMSGYGVWQPLFSAHITVYDDRIEFIKRDFWFWKWKFVLQKKDIDMIEPHNSFSAGSANWRIIHHSTLVKPVILAGLTRSIAEKVDPIQVLLDAGYPVRGS